MDSRSVNRLLVVVTAVAVLFGISGVAYGVYERSEDDDSGLSEVAASSAKPVDVKSLSQSRRSFRATSGIVVCGYPRYRYVPRYFLPRQFVLTPFSTGCGVLKAYFGKIYNANYIRPAWLMGHNWCVAMHLKPSGGFGALYNWFQAASRCGANNWAWSYVYYF